MNKSGLQDLILPFTTVSVNLDDHIFVLLNDYWRKVIDIHIK